MIMSRKALPKIHKGAVYMNHEHLISTFHTIFSSYADDKIRTFFSPGRINLIGEHTDYNGGYVFPSAITYGTYGLTKQRKDRKIRLYSLNFKEVGILEFTLDDLDYEPSHLWANYPKGVLRYITENGHEIPNGLDILIYGNIPNGAGLSSSASLEVLTGVMLNEVFELGIDRIQLVKIGQKVENEFIGVNSGIMDQFAIGMGKAKSAILLDCQTLSYEYAPFDLADHQIVIMNTNKRRELADSKYNERRSQCEAALEKLQTVSDITSVTSPSIFSITKLLAFSCLSTSIISCLFSIDKIRPIETPVTTFLLSLPSAYTKYFVSLVNAFNCNSVGGKGSFLPIILSSTVNFVILSPLLYYSRLERVLPLS